MFAPVESVLFKWMIKEECEKNPETTVIDVGGNIGYFALLAGSWGCKVHSFEPTPLPSPYFSYQVIFICPLTCFV